MLISGDTTSPARAVSSGRIWLGGAALVLAAFATYWNSRNVPFFFDDPIAVLENPSIRDLGDLGRVLSTPGDGSGASGRPIVNLSLAINYALGGKSVTGYHLANIFFHAAAGLALFGCVRRTLASAAATTTLATAALPLAFVSALLWVLHPLQTESVTCVIQRTELLVGLFYLLTLYCFIRIVETPSNLWSALAVVSCFLGMASKEVMVSAPLLVLLYDRTFVAGSFAAAWRQRRGIHLGLMASWLLLAYLVAGGGGTRGSVAGFGVGVTWWSYALKQCEAIIMYLKLTVWPNPLVVFYGVDVITDPAQVWLQIIVLAALVGATFYALWRKPVPGFLAFWFFAILAPSSSVVPLVSQTVSEHRLYLSLAAPVTLAVVALYRWAGRASIVATTAAAIALALTSAARNTDFRSELSIWSDTVAKVPQNARARVNLGAALKNAGNAEAALAQFQSALTLDPTSAESLNNVGSLLIDRGRPAEAIDPCRAALRLKPDFALAHNNLGMALVQTGKVAEGITHLRTALKLQPEMVEAHCNLIPSLLLAGQPDQAIAHGETAVRLKPDFALAHFYLANAYLQTTQLDRAVSALESAVKFKPDYADALLNLGSLYYRKGDPARAIPLYQHVLAINPTSINARNNLASAFFQTGKIPEAIEQYRAALKLVPTYVEARSNLALALERSGQMAEAMAEYETALRLKPDELRAKEGLARIRAAATPPPKP
ncbi:tetratricopeptide repeat protein [Horticoccus sp. 23ND18S-11]|uniref:tetratricopeptide repeat protein n=1 Tax=Horticoccus sp. 23ND18S-11 TaxID=3391832 RepID=UPI0039C8E9B8